VACVGSIKEYTAVDGVLYDADQISLELYPAGRADATFKFPETVSSIEEYAFAYAKNLQHLELPNHLTNVGESAFTFSKITKLSCDKIFGILSSKQYFEFIKIRFKTPLSIYVLSIFLHSPIIYF